MEALKSDVFDHLSWDQEDPEFPVLNGIFMSEGRPIEIALIGSERMQSRWSRFLSSTEADCLSLLDILPSILEASEIGIHALHLEYFDNEWPGSGADLMKELNLQLICFYSDGDVHLWFQGTAVFSYLEVEIVLDTELRPYEVRFDG